jgi:excisionase family DNA binding protein
MVEGVEVGVVNGRDEFDEDRLMDVNDVAKLLGLAPGTIYHLVSQGRIPFIRLSARCLKFRRSDILPWIERKSQKEKTEWK